MKEIDFVADLHFLTTEQGGRKIPAHSGYRPHIVFDGYPDFRTSGVQYYIGQDIVKPNETVQAEIRILSTEYFAEKLYTGMNFTFHEGYRMIGHGTIINIINQSLINSSLNIQK